MARMRRMLVKGGPAVYHVMSRTALDGLPLGEEEKDFLFSLIRKKSRLYFVEIIGICCMGNHFHILLRMFPEGHFPDDEIKRRFEEFHKGERYVSDEQIPHLRCKLSNLSEFMKEIKCDFSRYYNKKYDRRGYFWGDRFKSVIVEDGRALVNCLAYIDLNPVRAGIVKRPDDYKWSSIGYHTFSGNPDNFLSLDFGIPEFRNFSTEERLRKYRRFLYSAGAIDSGKGASIERSIVEGELKADSIFSGGIRLTKKTRHFSDSGVIGAKEFVSSQYQQFKSYFQTKKEKLPRPIQGMAGVYTLK